MKISILSAVGLLSTFALAPLSAALAQSEQPPSASNRAHCLQECFEQYSDNIRDCKSVCWICDFSLFGACLSGHHDTACMTECRGIAKDTYDACRAACV